MIQLSMRRVYKIPLLLASITCIGLLSALFGDGVWDRLSWIFLAIPLVIIAWKWCRSLRRT